LRRRGRGPAPEKTRLIERLADQRRAEQSAVALDQRALSVRAAAKLRDGGDQQRIDDPAP